MGLYTTIERMPVRPFCVRIFLLLFCLRQFQLGLFHAYVDLFLVCEVLLLGHFSVWTVGLFLIVFSVVSETLDVKGYQPSADFFFPAIDFSVVVIQILSGLLFMWVQIMLPIDLWILDLVETIVVCFCPQLVSVLTYFLVIALTNPAYPVSTMTTGIIEKAQPVLIGCRNQYAGSFNIDCVSSIWLTISISTWT